MTTEINLEVKELKLSVVSEAVLHHLKMKTNGALLLTGDWGAGKTYHIKNSVFPAIECQDKFTPIIISLFGVTDVNSIAQRVLYSYLDKKGGNSRIKTGVLAKNLKNIADSVPIIKKYINVEKLLTGTGDNVFNLLPSNEVLICFDDIERMSSKISIIDFIGIVNELVENKGFKVVLIANEDKIEGGINFKEKSVEKTVHYIPDISTIFDSIIDSYKDEKSFSEYLTKNKDFILNTLDCKVNDVENIELRKSFSNIRTVKFAIEHFKYAYIIVCKEENSEIIKSQLRSLWIFCLSISVEFRKSNNISFHDRKDIDNQFNFAELVNLSEFEITPAESENEVEKKYSAFFKELYYDRLSEKYIFYSEIYDFITGGKEINPEGLLKNLEEGFKIVEGEVNPADKLLSRFMFDGYWRFKDDEIVQKLIELLDYVKKGEFKDLVSHLNAGVYLLDLRGLISKSKTDVINTLKEGIELVVSKIKLNYLMKSQFEMLSSSFENQGMGEVIEHSKNVILKAEEENNKSEIKILEVSFENNILSIIENFTKDFNGIRTPDKPVFHLFEKELVKRSVKKWMPEELMSFAELLKNRYIQLGFANRLTDELIFLNNLIEGISEINLDSNLLSNKIIKEHLSPIIKQCKERLEKEKLLLNK